MNDDLKWALIDTLRVLNRLAVLETRDHNALEAIAGKLGVSIAADRYVAPEAKPRLKLKFAEP